MKGTIYFKPWIKLTPAEIEINYQPSERAMAYHVTITEKKKKIKAIIPLDCIAFLHIKEY